MFVKQCELDCVSVADLFVWQVLIQQWYSFTVSYKEQLISFLGILCLDVFQLV